MTPTTQRRGTVWEVAALFLKLGTISFGGPAAHIALMDAEIVRQRQWLCRDDFMDLVAVTNLVPGPNVVEMAMHIGYVRAGWAGFLAGGAAFILPATLISAALAWFYVAYGALPPIQALFAGITPVIIAIILNATYKLGRTAIKDWKLALLTLICAAAALLGVNQALILPAAGLVGLLLYAPGVLRGAPIIIIGALPGLATVAPAGAAPNRLLELAWFFFKVGALLFGTGMVFFAFVQRDLVQTLGWLTQSQLVDAIAVGQMTPGPILSSATFIGFLVAGWPGALIATVAVFFPSFLIMIVVGAYLPRLRRWPAVQAILKGVSAAVVALIAVVAVNLIRSSITDVSAALIGLAALILLLRFKAQPWQLVMGGAAFGLLRLLAA
jgi:chromate transporter